MDNFAASAQATLLSETTIADTLSLERAYDSYIREIEEATGQRLDNPIRVEPLNILPFGEPGRTRRRIEQVRRDRFAAETARLAEQHTGAFRIRSPEQLRDDAFAIVHGAIDRNRRIAAGAGTAGQIGQFLGAAGGVVADPPVLASMFVGAPAATGILRTMMIEAGIATTTEAVIQPSIQRFRARAGLPSGVAEAFKNIGLAAAGGGVFAGGIRAIAGGVRSLSGGVRELRVRNAQERAAARYLERQAALQEETPFGPAGAAEHVERTSQAQRDLAEGVPARGAEDPAAAVRQDVLEARLAADRAPIEEGDDAAAAAFDAGRTLREEAVAEGADANRLRADKETARRLAGQPDLDTMLDAARRGAQRPTGVRSLIDTLRGAGGIRDQGGELRHIGITGRTRPGLINNRAGMSLDEAAELAFESGFFGPNRAGFGERPTISDFLEKLRDDFEGRRVFRADDQAVLDEFDRIRAGIDEFTRQFDALGLDIRKLSNEELRDALSRIIDEPLPDAAGAGRQDAAVAARAAEDIATGHADAVDDAVEVGIRATYEDRLDELIWIGEGDEIERVRAGDVLDRIADEDDHVKEWFDCLGTSIGSASGP